MRRRVLDLIKLGEQWQSRGTLGTQYLSETTMARRSNAEGVIYWRQ